MKTIEIIISGTFLLGGLALVVVTIRYPRTVFVEIPLAIIKLPFYALKEAFFINFFLDLFGPITGNDINNDYKTKRKRYLTFSKYSKFLLTTGTDTEMVKSKLLEGVDSTNLNCKFDDFRFLETSSQTITIPPSDISFHDFNYLVQLLTDGRVTTVGLIESKRTSFTVYDDPETTNLIGQTDQGEKFFISLVDNFDKSQFLRISDDIQIQEEYNLSRIKSELSAQQATTHINYAGRV